MTATPKLPWLVSNWEAPVLQQWFEYDAEEQEEQFRIHGKARTGEWVDVESETRP